jgi:hypothetical protein
MRKRCFVIGPMGAYQETLNWLAHEVVKPLLPDEFEVSTPDSSQIGNIMTHVIKSCDRAKLVIADTTGNNPNVLYEIAVLDAMGRACIPIKIVDGSDGEKDAMPFDRAAYRYFTISKSSNRRRETDQILGDAITETLAIAERGDLFQNPLTDFFEVPLSSFSSASALGRGYYLNFVKPAARGLAAGTIEKSAFDPHKHRRKVLQIVMPDKIASASRANVEELVDGTGLTRRVSVDAYSRSITLREWTRQRGKEFRWMDVPTTMLGLSETVRGRMGRDADLNPDGNDYREIEADEIDQFRRAVLAARNRDDDRPPVEIDVVMWSETALPAPE